jgi:hypothetical protein
MRNILSRICLSLRVKSKLGLHMTERKNLKSAFYDNINENLPTSFDSRNNGQTVFIPLEIKDIVVPGGPSLLQKYFR